MKKQSESGGYPEFLSIYLGEPIKWHDCNKCKWLNITEEDQQKVKYRTYANEHSCMFYSKRVLHRAYNAIHDPFIFPCEECDKDGNIYFNKDPEEIESEGKVDDGCCGKVVTDGKIFKRKSNPKRGLCFDCY